MVLNHVSDTHIHNFKTCQHISPPFIIYLLLSTALYLLLKIDYMKLAKLRLIVWVPIPVPACHS